MNSYRSEPSVSGGLLHKIKSQDGRSVARLLSVYFALYTILAAFLLGGQTAYAVEFGTLCASNPILAHSVEALGVEDQQPDANHSVSCVIACTFALGADKTTGLLPPASPAFVAALPDTGVAHDDLWGVRRHPISMASPRAPPAYS